VLYGVVVVMVMVLVMALVAVAWVMAEEKGGLSDKYVVISPGFRYPISMVIVSLDDDHRIWALDTVPFL